MPLSAPPDLAAWRAAITKPPGPLSGLARAAQVKVNPISPEKAHAAVTA
jgi:hypothetical protein